MARERLLIFLRELSNRLRTSILLAKIRQMSKTTSGKMKLRMLLLLKQSNDNWVDYYISNNRRRRGGYGYPAELQYEEFSASSTPLIVYRAGGGGRRAGRFLYELLLLCRPACSRGLERGRRDGGVRFSIGGARFPDNAAVWWAEEEEECGDCQSGAVVEWKGGGEVAAAAAAAAEEEEDDGSVDEKAERFIERFYQEMRLQRRQSL